MQTTKGTITLELSRPRRPLTVNNFVFLSCTASTTASPSIASPRPDAFGHPGRRPPWRRHRRPRLRLPDEISSNLKHDRRRDLHGQRRPDTNGSQFFITLEPAPHLDGHYTAFGHVTEGMDVVTAITQGDVILSVSIKEAEH